MKKLMFAILALPLLAGCFWKTDKKADVVESTVAQETPATDEAVENAEATVADEMNEEK